MTALDAKAAKIKRKLGRMFKAAVPDSPELRRVMSIPRRKWNEQDAAEAVEILTWAFKNPDGAQTLRSLQAIGIAEAHDYGGLFGPIEVGEGKTLLTFLIPVAIEAERPLLIVPAKLREKTEREFAELSLHWKGHTNLKIESYERISNKGGAARLAEANPDLLLFDEVHRLKNKGAAVTRKITHWMEDHPDTKVIALSGTITQRSLLDFAHILRWCLPPEIYPLPLSELELAAWAAAVDEIKPHEKRMQGGVGALALLHPEVGNRVLLSRDEVREAVRDRLQDTPGVVASRGAEVAASLNIELVKVTGFNRRIEQLAHGLNEGEKPNGDVITDEDLTSRWRHMRTLTSGFWYDWQPPPPEVWMEARSTWKKEVRAILNAEIPGYESEGLIAIAAKAGKLKDSACKKYLAWLAVKDTYEPTVVPVWEDDRMIRAVEQWVNGHTGVVWVSEVALGERLHTDLGLPFFHRMGLDGAGRLIDTVPAGKRKGDCIIASVASNSEGRNLQHWCEGLITTPMPTGTVWEQLLGRLHRQGQQADEVWFQVFVGCSVEYQCWRQARSDARYASRIEGRKKLDYATIDEGSAGLWGLSESSLWQ